MQYCFNGEFYKVEDKVFGPENRAFRYGDALFETIFVSFLSCHFLDAHIDRLSRAMSVLDMQMPKEYNQRYFERKIRRLLNKNHHIQGARVRLSIFRDNGGLYTPVFNTVSYVIESEELASANYEFNKIGLSVDVYPILKKQFNPLSEFKTANSALFVMAGLWRKKNCLDDCIILNDNGYVCEALSSNIFIIKGDRVFTPPIESGCVNGIMRNVIIDLLKYNNIPIECNKMISVDDIFDADEMFITNSIQGIRKILIFRNKRFYSIKTKKIARLLHESSLKITCE